MHDDRETIDRAVTVDEQKTGHVHYRMRVSLRSGKAGKGRQLREERDSDLPGLLVQMDDVGGPGSTVVRVGGGDAREPERLAGRPSVRVRRRPGL
jgi:hypothetical protein